MQPTRMKVGPGEPGDYYRSRVTRRKRPWPGPRYLFPRSASRELMMVLSELIALTKTNAPLVQGLEAAAFEKRKNGYRGFNIWRAMRGAALAVLGLVFFMALLDMMYYAYSDNYDSFLFSLVSEALNLGNLPVLSLVVTLPTMAVFIREWGFRRAKSEAMLLAIRDRLEEGNQLSEALASLVNIVPPSVVDLTAAGENSGQLYQALIGIRDRLLAKAQAREQIGFTLGYGCVIVLIGGTLVSFLLIKVLPVFLEINQEFGNQVTRRTQILLAIQEWLVYDLVKLLPVAGLAAIVLALLAFGVFRGARHRSIRLIELPFFYVPYARRSLMQASLAPVCEVLAMLLKAGVPLPKALAQAERQYVHPHLQHTLLRVREAVEQGESFSAAARAQGLRLPGSFAGVLSLGEQSGRLPEALEYLADLYADNTQMRQKVLGQLLFPAMILALGMVVLFVEVSFYELIWGVTDAIFYSL